MRLLYFLYSNRLEACVLVGSAGIAAGGYRLVGTTPIWRLQGFLWELIVAVEWLKLFATGLLGVRVVLPVVPAWGGFYGGPVWGLVSVMG